MAAITWRNIEAPSFSDSIKAGVLAQQSFNAGFDNLNKILQERQALQEQNWQTNQDNLKQGFLDALYGAKSPEELVALQQSGQLNQMLEGMAPGTRAVVRGQDEQRRGDLMNRLTQQQQFTDTQQERTARPIVDRLMMLANSEDAALRNSAKADLRIYQEQGMLPNAGRLAGDILNAERGFAKEARAEAEDKRAQFRLDDQLKTSAVQRTASAESMLNARFNRERVIKESERAERLAQEQAILAGTPFNMGVLGTPEGEATLHKQLESIVMDPADRARVLEGIADFTAANPDRPVPVSLVLRFAAEHGNDMGWGQDNDMKTSLEALYEDGEFRQHLDAYKYLQARRAFGNALPKPSNTEAAATQTTPIPPALNRQSEKEEERRSPFNIDFTTLHRPIR